MNKLDEIERELRVLGSHWRPGHRSDIDTVLALVAVARAAHVVRKHPAVFHNNDAWSALVTLDDALAPLLAEKEG
jgi:hypothetical protein